MCSLIREGVRETCGRVTGDHAIDDFSSTEEQRRRDIGPMERGGGDLLQYRHACMLLRMTLLEQGNSLCRNAGLLCVAEEGSL